MEMTMKNFDIIVKIARDGIDVDAREKRNDDTLKES